MTTEDGSIIVIVKDLEHGDDQHEESDALVIRQDEQLLLQQHPPLHFDLTLKASKPEDDHTDDTCEISSRSSSHEDGREIRPCHQTKDADGHTSMPEWMHDLMWLAICFFGIMISFVAYGILLEYTTSGERRLHELSVIFITSVLGMFTAGTGRSVRRETIADIPASRFLLLGAMSLGSTFCAIRSLRYVIFPIQVLARSCKPVPVMLIGSLLGKKYPRRKYLSVFLIVCGVAMFMGGGHMLKDSSDSGDSLDSSDSFDSSSSDGSGPFDSSSRDSSSWDSWDVSGDDDDDTTALHKQVAGVLLLIASLFFDGGTGAYEDKLMSVHNVEPFDLMFKFQLSKVLLSGLCLVAFNQVHLFVEMLEQTGFYIVALGMCSAIGQVFIFLTIAKFGALTTSLMSLTRKVTTLTASIVIYDHELAAVQMVGLAVSLGAMMLNFARPTQQPKQAYEPTPTKPPPGDVDEEQPNELAAMMGSSKP